MTETESIDTEETPFDTAAPELRRWLDAHWPVETDSDD